MPTYRYEGDDTRVYPAIHRTDGRVLKVVPGEVVETVEPVADARMVPVVAQETAPVAPPAPVAPEPVPTPEEAAADVAAAEEALAKANAEVEAANLTTATQE